MNNYLLGLAWVFLLTLPTLGAGPAARPNVLLIVSDDQGYADTGFQGARDIPTPHLDRLAKAGVRCTSGYVTHAFCSPTRAGLMAGRYQQRFGHEFNPVYDPLDEAEGLPLTERLLPAFMREAGYATGWIGKWHLGASPRHTPLQRGFQETFGFIGGGHQFWDWTPDERQYTLPIERNGQAVPVTNHLTTAFGEEAAAFVNRHTASPWFLYLAFNAPHLPHQPTPERLARFADLQDPKRARYAAQVSLMDDAIGATLDAVRASGQESRTLVFFFSDNGGAEVNASDNTPLRGFKGSVYEGGIRVPFVVSWPGRLPAGTVYPHPVSSLDVLATALARAGRPPPTDRPYDGVDLVPYLAGEKSGPPHARLLWRTGGGQQWAMREGEWKLIRVKDRPLELYNLADDIGEKHDLAQAEPEVVRRLNDTLEAWNGELRSPAFLGSSVKNEDWGPGGANQRNPRSQPAPAPKAAAPPNIIVVLSDDMGFSDLGCYGSEIRTPHLDALAAGGLRFTQFYNTARCCPTRASLLTGLHPHQAGVGHMMDDRKLRGYGGDLNDRCVTIAEALQPAGYRNYAVGKWHVTPGQDARALADQHNWPLQRGFDRYYGTIHGAGSFWDPSALVRDNQPVTSANDPEYHPEVFYYTDAISDHAVRFIREHARDHASRPFFMYVAFTAAHWPMHAKESDIAKYRGHYDAGFTAIRDARLAKQVSLGLVSSDWKPAPVVGDWDGVKDRAFEARCMEVYAAMIDCMDQGIGRIVAALREQGQLDRTLIMFLQDNGGCAEGVGRGPNAQARADRPTLPPMAPDEPQFSSIPKQTRDGWPVRQGYGVLPGPKDTYVAYGRDWANVSNTPFREYKHWVHEGGISTPLIVHWPAGIPPARAGQLVRQAGQLPDIMATCLDVAGAAYPTEFKSRKITPAEGRSLVSAFNARPIQRDGLFWEHEGNRAVRVGRWKLVAKGAQGPWELYDMRDDRPEMHDLADEQPARVQDLAARWDAWARRADVLPWPWDKRESSFTPSTRTRFALGPDADLPRAQAPDYPNRGFSVTVRLAQPGREGVLVAQGGDAHGWALFLQDGRLHFAINRNGHIEDHASADPAVATARTITASLGQDATLTLSADDRPVVEGQLTSLPTAFPVDGLQVGRDLSGTVGDYAAPFAFGGKIEGVTIELMARRER